MLHQAKINRFILFHDLTSLIGKPVWGAIWAPHKPESKTYNELEAVVRKHHDPTSSE